jgi:hypothetical protein
MIWKIEPFLLVVCVKLIYTDSAYPLNSITKMSPVLDFNFKSFKLYLFLCGTKGVYIPYVSLMNVIRVTSCLFFRSRLGLYL